MPSLLMLHSQHNDAVLHNSNVADKLQYVNSSCVKGLPQQWDDRKNIHKIFTESISQDSDSRVPLSPAVFK